jgi:SAM-dependent methyltransferase
MRDQTDIFQEEEGDNWYRRNAGVLGDAVSGDHVVNLLTRWSETESVRSVCELGCANGWRLDAIPERLPQVDRLAGSDLSKAAIEAGRRRSPHLELAVGSLDEPALCGPFDVVIVSFVFHWVARERLAASIAAVDNLLRDGGALIIADFLPDAPCMRRYHHRTDVTLFTYKQDYSRCFTSLGIYAEIERIVFAHSPAPGADVDPQNRALAALLAKQLTGYAQA